MKQQVPPVSADPVRELRLALVCFGGVSLAIYMHGTTKEIHKLVRASHAYEQNQNSHTFTSAERTEAAYWELLKKMHTNEGVRTRVVVDVITGTSAGGINGVCLATALARNASQDALRDLWMNEGDIERLWRPALFGKVPWLSEHVPWKVRAAEWASASLLRLGSAQPPLRGDRMGRLLYDALASMTNHPAGETLVPDGLSLELFVTLTDLRGFHRFIRIRDRLIDDKTHRVAMRFRLDAEGTEAMERRDDFTPAHTGALGFAARGTSSFPGAFPPIGLGSFEDDLRSDDHNREFDKGVLANLLPAYRPPFEAVEDAWFIDGGVLDNKPFGHAIEAIVAKPASNEVRRWVVYLEPDPVPPKAEQPDRKIPGLLQVVVPSLSGIPRSEPIVDELQRLRRFNERVTDISRIITPLLEGPPPAELAPLIDLLDDQRAPDAEQMAVAMGHIHDRAREGLGATYPTYMRVKLQSIHRALAAAIAAAHDYPPESAQAEIVRAVLGEWQDARYGDEPASASAEDYVRKTDVSYRIRRLRFVVRGVNDLYREAADNLALRGDLDAAKRQIYLFIDKINDLLAPDALRKVLPTDDPFRDTALVELLARDSDADPQTVATENGPTLTAMMAALSDYLGERLENALLEMLAQFNELSARWDARLSNAVLMRFIGFPLWDTAIFPLLSLSEIQQFSPIQVARFSPDGARRFTTDGTQRLKGIGFHHFAAFFSRSAREEDYLWGRLDGAEQLLHLLGLEDDAGDAIYRSILDEEANTLQTAADQIKACRDKLSSHTT